MKKSTNLIEVNYSTFQIQNMVEKVSSFKIGWASWSLDLTTAGPLCVLLCLAYFTLWVNIEVNNHKYLGSWQFIYGQILYLYDTFMLCSSA